MIRRRGRVLATSPEAAPFSFAGGPRGVLLVHGFLGTPFELRPLGEALAARGWTVEAPALAGHCASARALAATTWPDWYASVERAFDALRARTDRQAVVGLSLGGLLTLELARHRGEEISAIGLLAAALSLKPWLMRLVRATGRWPLLGRAVLPTWAESDIADPGTRPRNPLPDGVPISATVSLVELMDRVRGHLGEVRQPAFIAHGRQDHTIPFGTFSLLQRSIGSRDVEHLVLERAYHVLTLDLERDLLCARLADFLDRHVPA